MIDSALRQTLLSAGLREDEIDAVSQALRTLSPLPSWQELCAVPLISKPASEDEPSLEQTRTIGGEAGLSPYLVQLAYVIRELPALARLYAEKGIDSVYFLDFVRDLRTKIDECRSRYLAFGTGSYLWHLPFFRLERFAFGCFQYNDVRWEQADFTLGSVCLHTGDPVHTIHIPSGRSIGDSERLSSYRKAFAFYGCSAENPLVVRCGSWLLNPVHEEMLPPTANLVHFLHDFSMVATLPRPEHPDAWRLFGQAANTLPVEQWPADNTLRKAYRSLLLSGGMMQAGIGILVFDGERILTAKYE